MILQRLVEYYDRIAMDPALAAVLPKTGYSLQKISFCVVLEADGSLQQIQSMLSAGQKAPLPRQLLVPGQNKPPGSGLNPCFLWDNSSYMLGYRVDDPDPERTRSAFDAFKKRHLELQAEIASPAFDAVCAFLREWSPEKAAAMAGELGGIVGSFGVFRIAGQHAFAHEDPAAVAYWLASQTLDNESAGHAPATCLVTGNVGPVARLHEPKIKGVAGAQTSGALLVSFNNDAYTSYGKSQSFNAPVGASAVFRYANVLNYLLNNANRRLVFGDTTFVFWAERANALEDFVSDLFADSPPPSEGTPPEDRERLVKARQLLTELRAGYSSGSNPDDLTRFFILGLSPNASRLSVRFWSDTSVRELSLNLSQHLRDMALSGYRDNEPPAILRRIVQATGRAEVDAKGHLRGFDGDSVSPFLAGAIARAVLTGAPYPQTLMSTMLRRMRSDGVVNHVRVAAVKACIARNSRIRGKSKEITVSLNTNRTDPAYVTGRLFALLEKIQADSAGGELNSTIKDRYFSSASATPAVVFPRLIRLSQHHMGRMEVGQKIYYERKLGEVVGKLDCFASHFVLEDQGLFAIGYFHQRQDLFTSKKDKQGEEK